LTGGLGVQNISAVTAISADQIVFADPASESTPSYSDSSVTQATADAWRIRRDVTRVSPLGITQLKVYAGSEQTAIAVFGAASGFGSRPPASSDSVALPRTAALALRVRTGASVTISGAKYRVSSVTADTWYSHTPVAWVSLTAWQAIANRTGNRGAYATVLAVRGSSGAISAADKATGTASTSVLASLTALDAFRSEIGSLLMIVAMLFAISALVVGAFFTVWGIQRQPDVAILKALGASNRMLVRDALGQAAIILVLGVGVGIAITAALGAAVGSGLPFILSPLTTVLPGAAMVAFGLIGAAFALRSVTRADPLTALGSTR
jgi:putative ABC transport system permease protein